MGKLRDKENIKKEFELICKQKKLKFKFLNLTHEVSGKSKIWKINFQCFEGHKNNRSIGNFRKGSICRKCNGLDLTNQEHIQRLSAVHNNFYKYKNFKFQGTKKLIKYFCPVHNGYYHQKYEYHLSGSGCGICKRPQPKKGTQIKKLVKQYSNGFVSAVKINNNKIYKSTDTYFIKCNVHQWHKIQERKVNKITRGVKCGFCNSSKFELIAYYTLHQLRVSFEIEHQIKFKNNLHYIDIVLRDQNNKMLFIEIDGEQHSSDKHWNNSKTTDGGKTELFKIRKRDKLKDEYARQKKIKLIRINYKENIKEKITSIINQGNFIRKKKTLKKFPFHMINTSERIASKVHKMYNRGVTYDKIISKLKVKPSFISNVVTGEKFQELYFYLYPDGNNPNLRRKKTKHLSLSEEEKSFLSTKIKEGSLFADIRREFSKKFKPISRGQFDRYAKKNNYKTPYFINLNESQLKQIKDLKNSGLNFNQITKEMNKRKIKISRPSIQKVLKTS